MNTQVQNLAKNIVSTIENHIDEEIEKLSNLDSAQLVELREKRMLEIKKEAELRKEWHENRHGEYLEIDEKEFFTIVKNSTKLVIHFYKEDAPRCKIFDHHLKKISVTHPETKFVKINAEKATFLAVRLKIQVIPTLVIVIENKTKDYIVGFTDLGNCDDFSTDMLEWRLALSEVIKYDADISQPPGKESKPKGITRIEKKTIKETFNSDSTDSD